MIASLARPLGAFLVQRSLRRQCTSALLDPGHWGLHWDERGDLSGAGWRYADLVQRFGSPLHVVHREQLVLDTRTIRAALAAAPNGSEVLYSYKTNGVPAILACMHELGVGAEVISPYELWLAHELGVPPASTVYNGVDKSDESLRLAAARGIQSINIDHLGEIDRILAAARATGRPVRVGVRLALAAGAQFGLRIDNGEALAACRQIAAHAGELTLVNVHFNAQSNARAPDFHLACLDRAMDFIAAVRSELGITIESLDIGGGFGVPTSKNMSAVEYGLYRLFGCPPAPPDPRTFTPIATYMTAILERVQERSAARGVPVPRLLIEPGRYPTSRAECLLTTVRAIKPRARGAPHVLTDAGRLSTAWPLDFEYHEILRANNGQQPHDHDYMLMGRICTSADWLMKHRALPELREGDVLAVMDAGAYFTSNATNFAFPRPAVVMVDRGEAEIVRRAETFADLVARDCSAFARTPVAC